MGYPNPADVRFGVVFGASNELTGTLVGTVDNTGVFHNNGIIDNGLYYSSGIWNLAVGIQNVGILDNQGNYQPAGTIDGLGSAATAGIIDVNSTYFPNGILDVDFVRSESGTLDSGATYNASGIVDSGVYVALDWDKILTTLANGTYVSPAPSVVQKDETYGPSNTLVGTLESGTDPNSPDNDTQAFQKPGENGRVPLVHSVGPTMKQYLDGEV